MITKPQCTTLPEVLCKIADWLKACQGTGIKPHLGVKYGESIIDEDELGFVFDRKPEAYEIAIGVLDGKIVWRDSVLYFDTGGECTVGDTPIKLPGKWSWNPPRQTITINGKEVAKPYILSKNGMHILRIRFATHEDAQQFRDALK